MSSLVRGVEIQNYKSIRALELELGRVNVFIGANGSGKSNLLEALVLGTSAARNKLDNEYLVPRGLRVTEPRFMRAAFPGVDEASKISVAMAVGRRFHFEIDPEEKSRSILGPKVIWRSSDDTSATTSIDAAKLVVKIGAEMVQALAGIEDIEKFSSLVISTVAPSILPDFMLFAPENSALRVFQAEPQLQPLGIRGEGLFAHLKSLSAKHPDRFTAITDELALLDWFERIEIPRDLAPGERSLLIRDRFLAEGALFDQRSANEGFLFLLFYLTLFISPETPTFFAIENVDTSLNPKLVTTLMQRLVALAAQYEKQVLFTTHNPAVLDGLDLGDPEQRLFVTERRKDGTTRARLVSAPVPLEGDAPLPLSQAFLRGYLGGLPKNF